MFSYSRTEQEARAAKILEGIYHKGHRKGWDGQEVLQECLRAHSGAHIEPDKLEALGSIFSVILWGELAAWKVSSSLAFELKPLEAKMAATSQAHDEARHFYVMNDYLNEIGYNPEKINSATEALLENVMGTSSLAKKLLGMQLMVEPVAITIFRFVREAKVEPVLSDLLVFYERDEARHIALGVQYLPELIRKMTWNEKVGLLLFQIKLLSLEVEGLRHLEPSFRKLGINSDDVFKFAEKKQMDALALLAEELGISEKLWKPIIAMMNIQKDLAFSKELHLSIAYNISTLLRRILLGS